MTATRVQDLPRTVLIANRGEIAVRIAHTCRRMGLRTIAVYSEADRDALHVAACDDAVCLTGASPADGYLDGAQIIEIARARGVDAIHPGYGFLSENAAFADACAVAGLVFIGPSAELIAAMGDKIAAKTAAAAAGVPIVPGVADEPETDDGEARDQALADTAAALAFPLLIKASAGGGGRGMRIVADLDELRAALPLARREALSSFGNNRLLVERYIENPRHIEVQIFGDRHGNVVHLFERDCSVQRRHQKIVEEAPAPGLRDETRAALHAAAIQLAESTGYFNAGTVEFVLDAETEVFYFLEVNTRLQVEHPVTEEVVGIDLVEWQIRVAAGQPLPLSQSQLCVSGWAIEVRITSEDAADDFRPHTGTIVEMHPPAGPGIRFDTGVVAGSAVTPYYDSMLAKVIAHGADRETALARLHTALSGMAVFGVQTNTRFLVSVLDDPTFRSGRHTTHFLAERPHLSRDDDQGGLFGFAAALVVLSSDMPLPACDARQSPWSALGAWRLGMPCAWQPRTAHVIVDESGQRHRFWIWRAGAELFVQRFDENEESEGPVAFVVHREGPWISLAGAGRSVTFAAHAARSGGGSDITVYLDGPQGARMLHAATGLVAWRSGAEAVMGDARRIQAPGPGIVSSIAVAEGDKVGAGALLMVTESMKMLQSITAPRAAVVVRVDCTVGQALAYGDLLIELEFEDAGEDAK